MREPKNGRLFGRQTIQVKLHAVLPVSNENLQDPLIRQGVQFEVEVWNSLLRANNHKMKHNSCNVHIHVKAQTNQINA